MQGRPMAVPLPWQAVCPPRVRPGTAIAGCSGLSLSNVRNPTVMTLAKPFHIARAAALGLALATSLPALAQTSGSGLRASSYSLLPYTSSGYIGLNLGKPDWRPGCAAGFGCSDADVAVHLYTGGLINDVVGAEIGYNNAGGASRNGGTTRAQGVNLSLVARVPLGGFNVFAKLGALYGETRVSADALSGVATGKERGWGVAYAAGVGYDFTPQMGVVLEWARDEYRLPGGGGRQDLDSVSLGLVRRF